MSEKLLNCPFCGSEAVDAGIADGGVFLVECLECQAKGPFDSWSIENAKENWNRRAPAPKTHVDLLDYACKLLHDHAGAPCECGADGLYVVDYMIDRVDNWCEKNCDKVTYVDCWRKFIEVRVAEKSGSIPEGGPDHA